MNDENKVAPDQPAVAVGDHSFCDSAGRRYTFNVNLWAVANVKKTTGIDLMKVVETGSDSFETLVGDWSMLLEVICTLLKQQMDQAGITMQDFGQSMDEERCGDAVQALMFSIIDFFQPAKAAILRTAFAKVWNQTMEHQDRMVAKAQKMVHSQEFDQMIQKELPEGR